MIFYSMWDPDKEINYKVDHSNEFQYKVDCQIDTLEQKSLISISDQNDNIGITEEQFWSSFSWNTAFTVNTNQICSSQK